MSPRSVSRRGFIQSGVAGFGTDAAAAAKSMGNCVATGHAAALAAVQAVKKDVPLRAVNVPELQERLKADGVDLEVTRRNSGVKK